MTAKTITKKQYQQLIGLKFIADKKMSEMEDIENAALDITQETDANGNREDLGHTSDTMYGSHSIDELLKLLKIKVVK